MNHGNSGLAHGTSGSSQLTLDNGDMPPKQRQMRRNYQQSRLNLILIIILKQYMTEDKVNIFKGTTTILRVEARLP